MAGTRNKKCYSSDPEFTNMRRQAFDECKCGRTPTGQDGDDCIATWKAEKAKAKGTLNKAIAQVNLASEALKYATEWEAKLKSYFDNIYTTADKADKVAREVTGLKDQVDDVCTNAKCTNTAIEILFCEVKAIFEPCVRQLVEVMVEVNACLKCITDPSLVRNEGILLALAEYDLKLREIEALQKDALVKVMEALKCANILYYSLCSAAPDDSNGEEYLCDSLSNELDDLCNLFGADGDSDDEPIPCVAEPLKCGNLTKGGCDSVFGINLEPVPAFPLHLDDYFKNTKCQQEKAQADKNNKKNKLDEAKKTKEAAQACFDSLTAAIDTAEKAKKGK